MRSVSKPIKYKRNHHMSEQFDVIFAEQDNVNGAATLNTLRYIILGLLGARPMSGYDIKQAFDRAIASYWNAGNSQIYTTLKSLRDAKLVEAEVVKQKTRPHPNTHPLTTTA